MQQKPMTFPVTKQGVRDLDRVPGTVLPFSGGPAPQASRPNVGEAERAMSLIGGSVLSGYGLIRGTPVGWALALAGGALLYRGFTGQCQLYRALGIDKGGPAASRQEMAYVVG